jgi:hypothetical protein
MSPILLRTVFLLYSFVVTASLPAFSQDAPVAAKQPLEHVLGAVIAVDSGAHTVTIKEDKGGLSRTILLADTKTLLKVEPGAKDLKSAVRIGADDLQVGDRVDVRGLKTEAPDTLAAKSVVLMSARDLQQAHQAQAAAWQRSTAGMVTALDAATGKITLNVRSAEGPKPVGIETSKSTEFTRYAPENPKIPAASQFAQIQAGDQVRVIGEKSEDGSAIKAQRVYSGAFRTFSATISAIGADGKSVTVKELATKKPMEVSLNEESAIRKLPPPMAMMLARRFNPNFKAPEGAAAAPGGGAPANSARPAEWAGGHGGGQHSGDISQMLEHVPKISMADLKPGDAVVISGVALGADNSRLLASSVIAGVEAILQSAPQRQGQSLGGDWGLGEMAVPQ